MNPARETEPHKKKISAEVLGHTKCGAIVGATQTFLAAKGEQSAPGFGEGIRDLG